MRIRTQLVGALCAAALVSALVGAVLVFVTRHAAQTTLSQAETQDVARHITSLVTLSLEITTFGSERAASQWRSRYVQLKETLDAAVRRSEPPRPSLVELRRDVEQLPELFEQLERVPDGAGNDQTLNRKQFLVERLVTELQGLVEARYRWAGEISTAAAADQLIFTGLVLGAPAVLLLLLGGLAIGIGARVLKPLARLQAAVKAIRDGDHSARCDTGTQDELGDTARAVDSMATTLQSQTSQLVAINESLSQEIAARRNSEEILQLVTDNLPAMVAYVDRERRFRFANRAYRDLLDADPDALVGRTLSEFYRETEYAAIDGHIEAAMAGDAVHFAHELATRHGLRHVEVATVPRLGADGRVQGMYMLTRDVTERRLVELERAARQEELEASLREKEVLLKEIHHRVKNNLQVISSLLQLQAGYIEDSAARRIFEESQGRIKSMALVHEKLYQSKDLGHIDFGEYVRDLVSGLSGSHGSHAALVQIDVQADCVQLDVDRAIPAGLVLNELVSNSFKHGFPENRRGRIQVLLTGVSGSAVQLTVQDDGVGWPAGFDPAHSTSLGLRLVHILAKQLRADLTFETGQGIRCVLTLEPALQSA